MDASGVCPTEDAIQAFLDHLVDPILPAKSSLRDTPSLSQQESVAKQMHAVVLLYNYYHRKQCPKLEVLRFNSFCKLVVDLKPALLAHMKFMKRSSDTELDDLEKQLSVTERTIMDACEISISLDASRGAPNTEGWPISKVTVLLIDSKKENCFLQINSNSRTQGVWSVIEKDMEVTDHSSDDTKEAKHVNKKKSVTGKLSRGESRIDETNCQKLAYSAITEATGISQTDLLVLESHVVFSDGKEKAAAYFFIVQCTQSGNGDIIQVPIKDVINRVVFELSPALWVDIANPSLPLVMPEGSSGHKCSGGWTVTTVVEYFHVLPYAEILLDWFCRREFSNGLQDSMLGPGNVNVASPKRIEIPCKPEICKNQDESDVIGVVIEDLGSNTKILIPNHRSRKIALDVAREIWLMLSLGLRKWSLRTPPCSTPQSCKQKDTAVSKKRSPADAFNGPQEMWVDASSMAPLQNVERCKENSSTIQLVNQQEKIFLGSELNGSVSNTKVVTVNRTTSPSLTDCRVANVAENKIGYINSSDQESKGGHVFATYQSQSKDFHKLQIAIASRKHILSQTALKVLMKRRNELSLKKHNVEDELARCEKDIQTIINGGEDDSAVIVESLIEGCSDVCLRNERTHPLVEEECSPKSIKRKRLSEAILNMQNRCQELDGICCENSWVLPTYCVSPLDGGFQANVTLVGLDFKCSSGG
ncbi:hypothetical protein M0R45_019653 [Rubus argutus]|uniref:Uncharacterized protein n=1 Tax=Rubus argutus TaxID=59490 RepID=A0AAW1X8F7_RUBAR